MNQNSSNRQHPRIKCGLCGMNISEKHLGRHRMRRHPSCPSKEEMIKKSNSSQTQHNQSKPNAVHESNTVNILSPEVQQSIADQSKKSFSDNIRYVKVRISETELIKLMNRNQIYHAVGKFFMYDSQSN